MLVLVGRGGGGGGIAATATRGACSAGATPAVGGGLSEGECHTDPSCLDHRNPPPMETQKWGGGGQDSGVADLQERIGTASCGEG